MKFTKTFKNFFIVYPLGDKTINKKINNFASSYNSYENKKYLNFKPGQFVSFDDIIVLSEKEFFKLPLEYEQHKFRKIIMDFKKEKKKRKL